MKLHDGLCPAARGSAEGFGLRSERGLCWLVAIGLATAQRGSLPLGADCGDARCAGGSNSSYEPGPQLYWKNCSERSEGTCSSGHRNGPEDSCCRGPVQTVHIGNGRASSIPPYPRQMGAGRRTVGASPQNFRVSVGASWHIRGGWGLCSAGTARQVDDLCWCWASALQAGIESSNGRRTSGWPKAWRWLCTCPWHCAGAGGVEILLLALLGLIITATACA